MHSNYLLTRHYIYCSNPEENLDAHLEWVERHVVRKEVFRRQEDHVPDPNKKLRVGYVSPDFRTHSVAYFLDPLFQNHDTNVFDVYCYSDVSVPDVTTRRLRNNVKIWRDTSSLGSSELVRLIRGDGIDLLVDLSGHTAGNRLMAFAEKPAPVQVTWLGYPDTTGLDVMDYRITDLYADPVGSEKYYSEHLVRLEGCFLCYEPPGEAPAVVVNPAAASRSLTFGSFNNRAKINCDVIKLWADILRKLPHARLLIKNPGLTDKAVCADLRGQFIRRGIEAERVVLKGVSATTVEHLEEYHNIDIALDTFPYNGTTTTCEALWMGVPVLTLSGGCHAGRVGRSLLSAVGLDDWVAETEKEYVDHAVAYANSPDALVRLRASMRQRMADSVLCDGKIFTAKLESVYRSMWVDWCRQF
jgi:predicted O-linked N-acetylglucosamine transferase (SPINDLY family)